MYVRIWIHHYDVMMTSNNVTVSIRVYQDGTNDEYTILCNSSGPIKSGFRVIEGGGLRSMSPLSQIFYTALAQRLTCGVIPGVLCDFSFRCLWMG